MHVSSRLSTIDAMSGCSPSGAATKYPTSGCFDAASAVSPFFLSPGRHWQEDIPALTAEAASKHPEVGYFVAAPLGLHPLMASIVESRLETCMAHLTTGAGKCDVCDGTKFGCKLVTGAASE